MVKVYLKDGGMCKYDGITAEEVGIDTDLGFLRIIDEKRNETVLIPWDNIRFVQADRPRNE